jgi:hypothetical protein
MAKHEDDKAPVKFYIAAALAAGGDGLPTIVALTPAMDDQTQAEKTARLYAEEHPGTWTTVLAPAETNRGYAVCFRGAVRVDHETFYYPARARAVGDQEPPPPEPLGLDAWRSAEAPEPTLPLRGSTRAEAEARAIPGLKEPPAKYANGARVDVVASGPGKFMKTPAKVVRSQWAASAGRRIYELRAEDGRPLLGIFEEQIQPGWEAALLCNMDAAEAPGEFAGQPFRAHVSSDAMEIRVGDDVEWTGRPGMMGEVVWTTGNGFAAFVLAGRPREEVIEAPIGELKRVGKSKPDERRPGNAPD